MQTIPADDELLADAEHVRYEIRAFLGAFAFRFSDDHTIRLNSPAHPAFMYVFLQNALVEGVVLHSRNLVEFLLPTDERPGAKPGAVPKSDDLLARNYLPGFVLTEDEKDAVEKLRVRANKELAHLTTKRVSDAEHFAGEKTKSWTTEGLLPLVTVLGRFVEQMAASCWYERATADSKAEWDAIRAAIPSLMLLASVAVSSATPMAEDDGGGGQ